MAGPRRNGQTPGLPRAAVVFLVRAAVSPDPFPAPRPMQERGVRSSVRLVPAIDAAAAGAGATPRLRVSPLMNPTSPRGG